ncbi:uncharacterized protein [Chelonus insularis]|uniref:uncharacterized protein n=1 Tax=Chelonus insularis TaxID=460826 RepID=UPI00158F507C|nr:uncharacterized protein LOC118074565 [Chelonus insularis]XP_034951769.1 uncharacterized protein LOC118074565 [Chelonus insularis]XP_034951770.1 uncharacterized protein LOC118074565 [Chelonus insularis]XP_034951771.1 uncharacterized protein LOC118074565 [Chelonus insularis]
MRDTSDMMDDAMSEDTVMDYGNDDGNTDDLINLATDISNSSSTIHDAAERLLTLLGVEDSDDDFYSSSEDEGVEVDLEDNESNESIRKRGNVKLLHQLANSLAQELRYSQKQSFLLKNTSTRFPETHEYPTQSIEVDQNRAYSSNFSNSFHHQSVLEKLGNSSSDYSSVDMASIDEYGSRKRLKVDEENFETLPDDKMSLGLSSYTSSWDSGWNACAHEAIRYLIEKEGLPPHHPTILALKNHLFTQKDKTFTQYLI